MASSYQLLLGGQQADPGLYTLIVSVEVEESMDMPAAVQIVVPVARTSGGDLTYVADPRFAPLASVAVVATAGGSAASGVASGAVGAVAAATGSGAAPSTTQCIFDGYVLSQKLHLETGTTRSMLTVWGQDASWLMNLTEKVKEWVDVTDADVANAIFADYSITPSDQNAQDDSPSHTEDGHSLMQRASDIQFLRMLARRNGKVCRIACADTPGARTGYFAKPNLDGDPAATITLNDPTNWTVSVLDLDWDATRPTAVVARQALFSDPDEGGVSADTSDSGLALLSDRDLATFTGQPMTVLLAAPVDSAGELALRAQAVLRDADWFVRCAGDADVERLGVVMRAGMIVSLVGIGALFSGRYLVWSVQHRITQEAHTMKFVLMRNAIGNPSTSNNGGLSTLVGAA
jgi:phage protein D